MEKTLNDIIESFFRGIVFIVFNSISTFGLLVSRPRSAPVLLVNRVYRKDKEQVRPYVFLFLMLFSIFLLPTLLRAGSADHDPYAYRIYENGEDITERSYLGKIFDTTVDNFEAKALLPITVAAVVGVSVFHITAMALVRLAFFTPFRRRMVVDALFFLVGAQVGLALCVWVVSNHFDFGDARHATWISTLMQSYEGMFASGRNLYNGWRLAFVIQACVMTWILLLPLPTALRLVSKSRWGRVATGGKMAYVKYIVITLLFTVLIDSSFWLTSTSAGLLGDKLSPHEKPPYQVKSVECIVEKESNTYGLTASVLVTATGRDAWSFTKEDFEFFVGAKRNDTDPVPKSKNPLTRIGDPKRIGIKVGDADSIESEGRTGAVLVEPGRWRELKVTIPLKVEAVEFLRHHPEGNRCTICDRNDYPVGRQGPLDRSAIQ